MSGELAWRNPVSHAFTPCALLFPAEEHHALLAFGSQEEPEATFSDMVHPLVAWAPWGGPLAEVELRR